MANHPWKTDNWFVSQWNYADKVRKDFKFAKQIGRGQGILSEEQAAAD